MTKSQQYFFQMLENHKVEFDKFRKIHDDFEKEPEKYQEEFNEVGSHIMDIIRDFENRLCRNSENSQFGKFSSNLADRFWELVRATFPKIDYVGAKIN